jgi:hypothetical protein
VNCDTEFICPNPKCDYIGTPDFENYGSIIAMFALLLLGVLPGVLYLAMCMGKKYFCPHCKLVLDKD